ncbi:cytochrome P450 [Psychromicrobium lacuslunae]|nr:cytochrome P450 [Psychromicrobium lacuslunae]
MNYQLVQEPDEVREVLRRVDDFLPTNALTSVVPLSSATLRILSKAKFALPPVLASATGERHRQVRQQVAGFFSPAKVASILPLVTEIVTSRCELTEAVLQSSTVDLAGAVGRHIPPLILQELIGVELPDLAILKTWSRDSLELFWGWPDEPRQAELAISAAAFYQWLIAKVEQHRGDQSLFGLLHATGLSVPEICSLGYFLIIAGQETTSQLISIAFYRALSHPGCWQALADGALSADSFVRQLLATESSVPTWRRVASRDTQLAGSAIPAGAEILLELSGHHLPGAGDNGYSLAFGHGLHRCLGAKLAELETVCVLQTTARLLPALRIVSAEPSWTRLLSFQSPDTVMVERTP